MKLDLEELRSSAHLEMERRMRTLARSSIDNSLNFIAGVESEARYADPEYAKRTYLRELRKYCGELLGDG